MHTATLIKYRESCKSTTFTSIRPWCAATLSYVMTRDLPACASGSSLQKALHSTICKESRFGYSYVAWRAWDAGRAYFCVWDYRPAAEHNHDHSSLQNIYTNHSGSPHSLSTGVCRFVQWARHKRYQSFHLVGKYTCKLLVFSLYQHLKDFAFACMRQMWSIFCEKDPTASSVSVYRVICTVNMQIAVTSHFVNGTSFHCVRYCLRDP